MFEIQTPVFWKWQKNHNQIAWWINFSWIYINTNSGPKLQPWIQTPLYLEKSPLLLFTIVLSSTRCYGVFCSCCMAVLYPVAAAAEQGRKHNHNFTWYPCHFSILLGGLISNCEDMPHWTRWIPEILMRTSVREKLMQFFFFFMQWLTRHFFRFFTFKIHLRSKTLAFLSTFFPPFF